MALGRLQIATLTIGDECMPYYVICEECDTDTAYDILHVALTASYNHSTMRRHGTWVEENGDGMDGTVWEWTDENGWRTQ